jgi:PIN domain nuclease of toxin-antitoxin system
MKVLLDTHALIWFAEGNNRLSISAKAEIDNINNDKYISIVSLWEIIIKSGKEKLELPKKSFIELDQFLFINNIQILTVQVSHLNALLTLPYYHNDPFDKITYRASHKRKLHYPFR